MANSLELREFQRASVRAVCEGLAQRSVYALADEVGLGKTLICAEVVNQLIAKRPKNKSQVIYYVAPSIELLHQNLRAIRRYLEGHCGEKFYIRTSISRLSQVPRDIAEHRRRLPRGGPEKAVIHIIGLSPGTSFNLRGAGQKTERTYLAALFGFKKMHETKLDLARFFWGLNRELDLRVEQKYLRDIEGYCSEDYFGDLLPFRDTEQFHKLLSECIALSASQVSEIRPRIGEVRRHVVNYLISSVSPAFVIFDEWHKYKKTCFKNELLEHFLAQARESSKAKVLLVSATPFSVEFKEGNQGEAQIEDGEDLEGLLQMIWGKQHSPPHYERLRADQSAYMEALSSYLKEPSVGDGVLKSRRDVYERHLRNYCTRTERPRIEIEMTQAAERPREGEWTKVAQSNSLHSFLGRFRSGEHVRSPILPMWSDGHGFPSFGYSGLERQSTKDLPGAHWKVGRLIERLKLDYLFEDKVHSFRYPPLWLRPEASLRNRKHLVFSQFLFVPDEICRQLDSNLVKFGSVVKKKWTGSVLGYFPTKRRRRNGTEQSAAEAIHFILFYPFMVFELAEARCRQRVKKERLVIEKIIATETHALAIVRQLEELFCENENDRQRLDYRWRVLEEFEPIPASARFKEYVRFLFFSEKGEWSLSAIVARVLGELWQGSLGDSRSSESSVASKDFEAAAMRLSSALLRLFASPEAQTLKVRVRVKLPRAISRRWNSHVRFAIWYSKEFDLESTLRDFAKLLSAAGAQADVVVDEIAAAIALRKGSTGNRFVRSFHDRKIGDSEYDDREDTISLKSLRAAFNSPFPPYVLVSTSVGQEGLDFHRYCASVIHWSPPSSPSVLRQREGRVDRFQSLQIRRALQECGGVRGLAYNGMSPDFVLMRGDKRLNRVDREVWYLPFTAQEAAWKLCLQRMYYNDLLIGAPDPLADERLLLGSVGGVGFENRIARFEAIRKYAISLAPRDSVA